MVLEFLSLYLSLSQFGWLRVTFCCCCCGCFSPYIYIHFECHFCISVKPHKHLAIWTCVHTFRKLPKRIGSLRIFILFAFTSCSVACYFFFFCLSYLVKSLSVIAGDTKYIWIFSFPLTCAYPIKILCTI